MINIQFITEDTEFELTNSFNAVNWVKEIGSLYNRELTDVTYIFCSDTFLLSINQEHLQHDTLTDIITFNYNFDGNISGDIFISIDRVKENAKEYNVTFHDELKRVMSHGLLHLFNYNDKTDSDKRIMRAEEDKCIALQTF